MDLLTLAADLLGRSGAAHTTATINVDLLDFYGTQTEVRLTYYEFDSPAANVSEVLYGHLY